MLPKKVEEKITYNHYELGKGKFKSYSASTCQKFCLSVAGQ